MILDEKTSANYLKEIKQDMAARVLDEFIQEEIVEEGVQHLYLDKIVESPREGLIEAIGDALSNDSPVRDKNTEYLSWEELLMQPLMYANADVYREPAHISEVLPILKEFEKSDLLREEAFLFVQWFYPMFDFTRWGRRNIVILAVAILDNCLALGEDGQVYFDRINLYESVDRAFRNYGDKYKEYDEPLVVSII